MKCTTLAVFLASLLLGWSLGGCATITANNVQDVAVEDGHITGHIANSTNAEFSFVIIRFAVFDRDGERLGWSHTDRPRIHDVWEHRIKPGEVREFRDKLRLDEVASVEIDSISAQRAQAAGTRSRESTRPTYIREIYRSPITGHSVYVVE